MFFFTDTELFIRLYSCNEKKGTCHSSVGQNKWDRYRSWHVVGQEMVRGRDALLVRGKRLQTCLMPRHPGGNRHIFKYL